jgi:hypothetical protein
VRRRSPALLCRHRYSVMATINLSIKRGEVCGARWKRLASSLRGLCGVACRQAKSPHAAAVAINTFLTSTTTRHTSRLDRRSRHHIKGKRS